MWSHSTSLVARRVVATRYRSGRRHNNNKGSSTGSTYSTDTPSSSSSSRSWRKWLWGAGIGIGVYVVDLWANDDWEILSDPFRAKLAPDQRQDRCAFFSHMPFSFSLSYSGCGVWRWRGKTEKAQTVFWFFPFLRLADSPPDLLSSSFPFPSLPTSPHHFHSYSFRCGNVVWRTHSPIKRLEAPRPDGWID
jgi:hypothetical protein